MTSDSERALTPAEEAGAYRLPDYEDVIRQGGRIGDSIRRAHPYASQVEMAAHVREAQAWAERHVAALESRFLSIQGALDIRDGIIGDLTRRITELEQRARSRDEYEAEMRDRG
jgi:hypothetical protein